MRTCVDLALVGGRRGEFAAVVDALLPCLFAYSRRHKPRTSSQRQLAAPIKPIWGTRSAIPMA